MLDPVGSPHDLRRLKGRGWLVKRRLQVEAVRGATSTVAQLRLAARRLLALPGGAAQPGVIACMPTSDGA